MWVLVFIPFLAALALAGYRWWPVRIVVVVLAFFLVGIVGIVQSTDLTGSSASPPADSSTIRSYDLQYDVAASGDQTLTETLDVQFTERKHGIYRFFDESDGVDPDVTHPVTVQSVQRCDGDKPSSCVDEPYTTYYESGSLVAKIGDADVTYRPGTVNRYVITSTTTGALTQPWGSSQAQWYWDVIGGGWAMPIDLARVTVRLPAAPTAVRCATSIASCSINDKGAVVTGSYESLEPGTPVTWQADLPTAGLTLVPVGGPPEEPAPWWRTWFLLVPGALLGLAMAWGIRKAKERDPSGAPAFDEPSRDILPAVWTYSEKPPSQMFQVMLLQLQQLGAVQVELPTEGAYLAQNPGWLRIWRTPEPLPMIAGAGEFVDGMGIGEPGAAVVLDKSDVEAGRRVRATDKALHKVCSHAAQAIGYYRRSTMGTWVIAIASALPVLAVIVAAVAGWWAGLALLIPSVVGLWARGSLKTQLTDSGLAVRDQVAGLHTALSTDASVERFDYAARVRYFGQFLPWAVALGCARQWAENCRPDFPPDHPEYRTDPAYLSAWNTYNTSQFVSTAVASVSAGAVAAYAASQAASSGGGGGGGGFSGGGGSGGGGGGSW